MLNSNDTFISGIPHSVRFWYFLSWDILCLACTLFNLYFLLFDRTLRQALHNHVFIIILFIVLLYELINIPWFLRNDYYNTPWITSSTLYIFWVFIDYALYSLQIGLFAWATIERHILIFHDQWVATKKKRLFVHYLPVIGIIVYYLIYYSLVYFATPCDTPFDDFLTNGVYRPCAFDKTYLGTWDLVGHQVIPTLIIVIFCIALLLRVLWQKVRMHQAIHWRKHRKMTIQLLSMSTIYMIFNAPWVLFNLSYQFGLSENIVRYGVIYTKFLSYNVIFLYPFAYCLSLPELRVKLKLQFLFRGRQRRVGVVTGTQVHPRNGEAFQHYNLHLIRP